MALPLTMKETVKRFSALRVLIRNHSGGSSVAIGIGRFSEAGLHE